MPIISITFYATDGNEAENRSDTNNGQSSTRVSAFPHNILQIRTQCYSLFALRMNS